MHSHQAQKLHPSNHEGVKQGFFKKKTPKRESKLPPYSSEKNITWFKTLQTEFTMSFTQQFGEITHTLNSQKHFMPSVWDT